MVGKRVGGGTGRAFQRVADTLRSRLADGRTYPIDRLLPSERELAAEFDVSRDTVQRVLRELRSEGWIRAEQGRGNRVVKTQSIHSPDRPQGRAKQVNLALVFDEAFAAEKVTLDVYSLTSESLVGRLQEQASRIRRREISPRAITVRMLLPAKDALMDLPRLYDGGDSSPLLERLHGIIDVMTGMVRRTLEDLQTEGWVPSVTVTVRYTRARPQFKLYLVNRTEALHALYRSERRVITLHAGGEVDAVDILGMQATLIHYETGPDPGSHGSLFVRESQRWFDEEWGNSLSGATWHPSGATAGEQRRVRP
ncbi:winged helix-turn-helix domain-containing protein [Streptomyces sp. BPTC-684]|uniref:GntR family transcriptional regulator n=1 Tax=Streptomyces sp. BPTC-684 TaxID=3043734 RepID=UPI0024B174C1|nr:winged helix-turn-helix domain-containing protein [Streptomyces sp. BPTC-684]WHM38040.1 winged helix-turn-helix domain-containing protein [Streptomyces sp. BPTC-684]